ncbi:hypothetical protein RND71_042366 [Anisodus tanguticus]|uniref:Uncharacterized protein n=1 Tax=Anisodus tanguticus TaxID=243964 RepID=A0AAE1QRD1_9SOLA|nr:hypothetical protein RND71_042366 [Anisodus tanguticus]
MEVVGRDFRPAEIRRQKSQIPTLNPTSTPTINRKGSTTTLNDNTIASNFNDCQSPVDLLKSKVR